MLLLFYAMPPITAYPEAQVQMVVPVIDEEEDEIAILAYYQYFE